MKAPREKMQEHGDIAFPAWLEDPSIKFLIHLVPPGEHPDLLLSLLRTAFDVGMMHGASVVTVDFAKVLMGKGDPNAR